MWGHLFININLCNDSLNQKLFDNLCAAKGTVKLQN